MATFTTRESSPRDFHTRTLNSDGGISYSVIYIGRVRVNPRMQMLDFKSRVDVIQECVMKICEYSMQPDSDKIRKDEAAADDIPSLKYTGLALNMNISCTKIEFRLSSDSNVFACCELVNILDVFLGEWSTSYYVGVIAKHGNSERYCFLLKCPQPTARFVFSTVRESFRLRFGEYHRFPGDPIPTMLHEPFGDISAAGQNDSYLDPSERYTLSSYINEYKELSIDVTQTCCTEHGMSTVDDDNREINIDYIRREDTTVTITYSTHSIAFTVLEVEDPLIRLKEEMWFHGEITEIEAESLLLKDGDFLVRQETVTFESQFVLSCRNDERIVHLHLLNVEGDITTRNRIYRSVNELVEFHYETALPVISQCGALTLKHKIFRSEDSVLS